MPTRKERKLRRRERQQGRGRKRKRERGSGSASADGGSTAAPHRFLPGQRRAKGRRRLEKKLAVHETSDSLCRRFDPLPFLPIASVPPNSLGKGQPGRHPRPKAAALPFSSDSHPRSDLDKSHCSVPWIPSGAGISENVWWLPVPKGQQAGRPPLGETWRSSSHPP